MAAKHKHYPVVHQTPCCHYLVCGDCGLVLDFRTLADLGVKTDDWVELPELGQPSILQTGVPGVVNEIDKAFYDITVQQRNAAWREIERLEKRLAQIEETHKELE